MGSTRKDALVSAQGAGKRAKFSSAMYILLLWYSTSQHGVSVKEVSLGRLDFIQEGWFVISLP